MRWLLLASLLVYGCGGSVSTDGGGHAAGGTVSTGGTGNIGGQGAVGGDDPGGFGGAGGAAPFCCATADDCPHLVGEDEKSMSCVNGQCKLPPPPDKCWQDSDCQFGTCLGAGVCPCGDDTLDCIADQLGDCMTPSPPPSNCCNIDMDCGDEEWVPCVNGSCKQIVADGCWKDEQCPLGQTCIGASVCPCDALCAVADHPGKCG